MHEVLKYPTVHEALLYEKLHDDTVRCGLCERSPMKKLYKFNSGVRYPPGYQINYFVHCFSVNSCLKTVVTKPFSVEYNCQ